MQDLLKFFVTFFTDASRKITHKVYVFLFIVLVAIFINNVFGFSYYFNTNRKLDLLKEIAGMRKDSSLSTEQKQYLAALEKRTIKRENVVTNIVRYAQTIGGSNKSKKDTVININADNKPVVKTIRKKDPVWNFITANVLILLLMFFLPFIPITAKGNAFDQIIGVVVSEVFLFFLTLAIHWLTTKIPLIWNDAFWNYGLNVLFNLFFIIIIVGVYDQRRKKLY